MRNIKKGVKRNNLNSTSSNDNSTTNTSRSSTKFNNRAKWNICKSTKCSEYIRASCGK